MKLHVRWYPNLAVAAPEDDDPAVQEAFEMLAANIARGLVSSRGDSLAISLVRGKTWLGARIHCNPSLCKRERREVRKLVDGLSFLFPWIPSNQRPKEESGHEEGPLPLEDAIHALLEDDIAHQEVQIFDPSLTEVAAAVQQLSVDSDSKMKVQSALKKLLAHGTARPRSQPIPNWERHLTALEEEFPGFSEVIRRVVRPHLALIAAGAKRARQPPVLLVGPPGVGKSMFARRLAQLLGAEPLSVDMASATNNATLAGSSTFWANSQPGLLFSALAWGSPGRPPVADPVVILDEVDKTSSDRYDPLGPLYTLLEPSTAKTFEDQALPGIVTDASFVRWVLTANDTRSIPDPIMSRVLVFEIQRPSGQELAQIAHRMLESTIRELDIRFESMIPKEAIEMVSKMGPREFKVRLESAIGTAIGSGRSRLVAEDFVEILRAQEKVKLGFV